MNLPTMKALQDSWSEAWSGLGCEAPAGLFDSLAARYSEPHRAYHNLRHIEECFDSLGPAAHLAERLPEVQLALWFHDAIYDPRARDNEQASADLARDSLTSAGASSATSSRIHDLVLATRHRTPAQLPDGRLVADLDLAILAAPKDRFREYQEQIRMEYAWMPREEFRRRRMEILEGFLSRDAIYQTDWFKARLEQAARANIAEEISGGRNDR